MIEHWIELIPNSPWGNGLLVGLLILSVILLCRGADRLVDAAVDTARDLGVSQLIIGATIVSLGTTSPETAVSVVAALRGRPGLALGNGVGSLICDQCLILGMAMTVSVLPIRRNLLFRQSSVVFLAAVVLTLMAVLSPTQTITRPMGYVLVTGLALYLYTSYRWARADRELNEQLEEVVEETPDKPLWFSLVSLVIGLIVLVLGSELMVPSASLIAGRLGVPEAVIAATVVAFGTSLPELMTAIASIRKGQPDIILGNVLGADALNILFVVGASASAAPLKVGPVFYQIQAPVMILVVILFQVYIFTTKKHFRRWQGLVLLACYVAFVVLQYIKVGVEI